MVDTLVLLFELVTLFPVVALRRNPVNPLKLD
jgi:hypothetical protein